MKLIKLYESLEGIELPQGNIIEEVLTPLDLSMIVNTILETLVENELLCITDTEEIKIYDVIVRLQKGFANTKFKEYYDSVHDMTAIISDEYYASMDEDEKKNLKLLLI